MQPVLERGSIDNPLNFDVGLIQLNFVPVCSPNTCNMQHFSQIAARVCTLVLSIIGVFKGKAGIFIICVFGVEIKLNFVRENQL